METLLQDVRYGIRMLAKSPGFTAVAVLTLALGIGANTAIFTLVNALLLKTLPVKAPHALVVVGDPSQVYFRWSGTPSTDVFSYPLYKEFRDKNNVFIGLAAAGFEDGIAVDGGAAGDTSDQAVNGRLVSGNYFSVLGVDAAGGRVLTESDDSESNANPVVVLSYAYWKRRFASSAEILNKAIRLNGSPFTVVGIAQEKFHGDVTGDDIAVFLPISAQPAIMRSASMRDNPRKSWLSLIGRLRSGVGVPQAKADVNFIFRQALQGAYGASIRPNDRQEIANAQINVSAAATGLSALRREYRTPLLLLMAIVGLVLMIACVNVANLLLARATMRTKEIAMRLALGASSPRLLRQLLTESGLLAILGGVLGALLSFWAVRLLLTMFGSDSESLPLSPDFRLLAFALAVCFLTALLFGVVPAVQALKVQVTPTLKQNAGAAERRSGFGWGKGLVAAQVALSVLVLFSASLLVRSLQKLLGQDFGYNSNRMVVARVEGESVGYHGERIKQLALQLADRLSTIPGVRGATYSQNGLFSGGESSFTIKVQGFESASIDERSARAETVGAEYFPVLGTSIVAGRGIGAQDTSASTRVAVVNTAFVKHFFHDQNPIGRQFEIDDPDHKGKPMTVIGVSREIKDRSEFLREAGPPRFYTAYQQEEDPRHVVLELNVSGDPNAIFPAVRAQVKDLDGKLPLSSIYTVRYLIEKSLGSDIALTRLSGFFAALALLLACIGLYGVMSYTVAGRTREMGVRLALGAQKLDVLQLVLREGMLLVAMGLLIGTPLSIASSRALSSYLFGLKGADPLSLAAVIVTLGTVAAAAAFVPARRATKVDPIVALRYE